MLNNNDLQHLYQFACVLTQNDEQAYDLVHEAVLTVRNYNPKNYRAYSKVVIRNLYYKMQKNKLKAVELEETSGEESLEDMILTRISVSEIFQKIEPEERELLFDWAVEDKTIAEIAREKGTKLGTLLSKVSRLKKKIKKLESSHE